MKTVPIHSNILKWRLRRAVFLLAMGIALLAGAEERAPTPPEHEGAPLVGGEPQPPSVPGSCSLLDLTRQCRLFPSDGPRWIRLPDGSLVRNFASREPERQHGEDAPPPRTPAQPRRPESDPLAAFTGKTNIRSFLREHSAPVASEGFLDYLSAYADKSLGEGVLSGKGSVETPWPANQSARMREVDASEVQGFIRQKLFKGDEGKWTEFSALLQKFHSPAPGDPTVAFDVPPAGASNADLSDIMKTAEARKPRALELIRIAKQRIIDIIRRGRPDDALSLADRKAITKVESVTIRPPQEVWGTLPCEDSGNAFYSSQSHSVTLCPEVYALPEYDFLSIVAHEISHSIDPCNFQPALLEIDGEKARAWHPAPDAEGLIQETSESREQQSLVEFLAFQSNSSSVTNYPFEYDHPTSRMESLEKAGVIKTVGPKTNFKDYPFLEVFRCLQSKQGGDFGETAPPLSEFVAAVASRRADHGVPMDDKGKQELENILSSYPNCDPRGSNQHTKVNEAFAEWTAAQVVGEELERTGTILKQPAEKIAPFSKMLSVFCATHHEMKQPSRSREENIGRFLSDKESLEGAHPSGARRVRDIFLRNPKIRKALGCSKKEVPQCSVSGKE